MDVAENVVGVRRDILHAKHSAERVTQHEPLVYFEVFSHPFNVGIKRAERVAFDLGWGRRHRICYRQPGRLAAAALIQIHDVQRLLQTRSPRVEHVRREPRPAVQDDQVRVRFVRPAHSEVEHRTVDNFVMVFVKGKRGERRQKQQATDKNRAPEGGIRKTTHHTPLILPLPGRQSGAERAHALQRLSGLPG